MSPVNQQRRDFLKTVLRTGALAGLAGVVIPPLIRNKGTCTQSKSCAECGQFGRCDQPQAVDHRNRAGGRSQ